MCLKLQYSSNNSYWQYCDISNCFLWVPQNWITYTDLAHMWQNQCHSCPPNSHLFASSLKTHFPYWPISRIEPGPGGSFWIWSFWWRNFKAGSCAGRVAKANLRREIYVGIQGQTWNVTFSCSTYLTEQYSLRKLSPKLVNLFKLGAWLSQRDLRNPLIWRHTHGIPFGVQSREWLETAAPLTLARWTNIWPNLRIELTYQLSKFSFSRNFHVLLSC